MIEKTTVTVDLETKFMRNHNASMDASCPKVQIDMKKFKRVFELMLDSIIDKSLLTLEVKQQAHKAVQSLIFCSADTISATILKTYHLFNKKALRNTELAIKFKRPLFVTQQTAPTPPPFALSFTQ